MAQSNKPWLWTIAGSDNCGAAGVQKDLLTMHDLGGAVSTVVTCITSQSREGIVHFEAVSAPSFAAQLQALRRQGVPAAIKIGMLASAQQVELLTDFIQQLKREQPQVFVVIDPVLNASAGGLQSPLLMQDMLVLIRCCDLVTPNIDETCQLLGLANIEMAQALAVARHLYTKINGVQNSDVCAVLLKGGHLDSGANICDFFISRGEHALILQGARVVTDSVRGTGCLLASAIATVVALGYRLEDALVVAKAYVQQAISKSHSVNHSRHSSHLGWPVASEWMPRLREHRCASADIEAQITPAFAAVDRQQFRFYPVVDSFAWVEKLLHWGVKTLQLRIKAELNTEVVAQIRQSIILAKHVNAQLFINDHWQLAIELDAYGVHLGQQDLEAANLSQLQSAGLRLGVSTHGYCELLRAVAIRPSYIALGHVFPTQTKVMPSHPQGLARLARYQQWAKTVAPTVAIGGINHENLEAVLATGIDSIAMVSAVTTASDPKRQVQHYNEVINAYFCQQ